MPVNTQELMRQYDEVVADNARMLNEIERLRAALKEIAEGADAKAFVRATALKSLSAAQ